MSTSEQQDELKRLREESAHFRTKWREEWEHAREAERRCARLDADLEQSRADVARLSTEKSRRSSEALQEARTSAATRNALHEAQSEAYSLRTERELLRESVVRSDADLAEAHRRIRSFRDQLAEIPSSVDSLMVQDLRDKLLESNRKKAGYKSTAREQANRASSLALMVRQLEGQLNARQQQPGQWEGVGAAVAAQQYQEAARRSGADPATAFPREAHVAPKKPRAPARPTGRVQSARPSRSLTALPPAPKATANRHALVSS